MLNRASVGASGVSVLVGSVSVFRFTERCELLSSRMLTVLAECDFPNLISDKSLYLSTVSSHLSFGNYSC